MIKTNGIHNASDTAGMEELVVKHSSHSHSNDNGFINQKIKNTNEITKIKRFVNAPKSYVTIFPHFLRTETKNVQ